MRIVPAAFMGRGCDLSRVVAGVRFDTMVRNQRNRQLRRNFSREFERLEGRQLMAAYIVGNPTAYATIQAAVDAALPSAIIDVDAGTYNEQVYVDKPLTVRGARAGVDGRSNLRTLGGETVLNGALTASNTRTSSFYIGANNVTIDGFTIQGQTTIGDEGAGVVIGPNRNGTHFVNNIVQNNVAGLFLSNDSPTNPAVIQYNLFRGNNNAGANGGRAIYTNGAIFGDKLVNVLIDNNAFQNNRGGSGTTSLEAAIAIQAFAAGKQSDITITNNVMDNNGKAVLFFNTDRIVIKNNYITNTLDHYSGTLRFEGNNHDVTIQNNTVYNNPGPAVAVDSKGVPGDNWGFVVTNNNFYGNSLQYGSKLSVVFDDTVYIGSPDVRYNYWGSASGPGGDGSGTGDGVYGIGHVNPGGQWTFIKGGNELWSPFASSPVGSLTAPFWGLPASDGAVIQAEDFNHGGNGAGYFDSTAGNTGAQYRPKESVDLVATTDATGGGRHVQNIVAGEWLGYTINLAQGGVFNLDLRVANAQATGGKFHLEVDGVDVTGQMIMPTTGSDSTWTTLSKTGISLSGGQHLLKLVFDVNGNSGRIGNLNWLKLTNTAPIPVPATPGPLIAVASGFAAVNLTWNDNSIDETGFIIERRILSGQWQQIASLGANATAHTDNTVLSSTTYSYRVRATGVSGDSANSFAATVTTPAALEVTYLSDLPFFGTPINGWGPIERDQSVGGEGINDGQPIKLNGVIYTKGLGAHAVSDVTFNLGGAYSSFLSDIGVDDKQLYDGTIVFQVFADGVKIFDSGVMTPDSATQNINLNVAGVQQLRLHVEDAGDGIGHDHADWADARLTLAPVQPPPPPPPPPAPTAPPAPNGVAATGASTSIINIFWNDVTGETGYIVERTTDGANFSPVGTLAADSIGYTDSLGLAPGTTYYYRVLANNNVGSSPASVIVTASTFALPTPPAAPSGLIASSASMTQINLTWTDNSTDETDFVLERSLDGVNGWTAIATPAANATSYNDATGLSAGTAYYYRIHAINGAGSSTDVTASATTAPAPTAPAAPSNLLATAVSVSQINLTWSDNAVDETGFVIEQSADGVNGWATLATPAANVTSFSHTGLLAGTSYYYRVRATNAVGSSGNSNIASATTAVAPVTPVAPAAPSNLVATAISTSQINLIWTDASNNETGFIIERSLDGTTGWSQIAAPAANATSYSNTGLAAGTKYFYRVRAMNGALASANSAVANATTTAAPVVALPAGWSTSGVGAVGIAGSATYSGGAYAVTGAGAGMSGTADAFQIVSRSLNGNGTMVARVAANTGSSGIVLRESLSANAKCVALIVNPDGSVSFTRRTATGGTTATTTVAAVTGPQWLKLTRSGNGKTFTAYRSTNGTTWTTIGSVSITMSKIIQAGLVVASKSTTIAKAATFDNVSVILG
jgi:titin